MLNISRRPEYRLKLRAVRVALAIRAVQREAPCLADPVAGAERPGAGAIDLRIVRDRIESDEASIGIGLPVAAGRDIESPAEVTLDPEPYPSIV